MKKLFWIPWLFAGALIYLTLCWVQNMWIPSGFFQLPSIIATFGLTFVILLTQYSLREIINHFRRAFDKTDFDAAGIEESIRFFKTTRDLMIAAGVFGTVAFCVGMLSDMRDPLHIGRYFDMMQLCVFYPVVTIFFITVPFTGALKKRLAERPAEGK